MAQQVKLGTPPFLAFLKSASGQYQGWRHAGSCYLLTTPAGADLPDTWNGRAPVEVVSRMANLQTFWAAVTAGGYRANTWIGASGS